VTSGVVTAVESLGSGDVNELHTASSASDLRTATDKCSMDTGQWEGDFRVRRRAE
jgi:hypothetical protein